MKSAGADRRDLGPQPVQRVAVDARQQPAVAPFDGRAGGSGGERAAQHDAVRFECRAAPRRRPLARSPSDAAERRAPSSDRAIARRPRSSSTQRSSRVHARAARARRRRRWPAAIAASGMDREQLRQSLGGHPDPDARRRRRDASRAPGRASSVERAADRRRSASPRSMRKPAVTQRVVQLVGVARIRPRLVAHARDRGRVERADARRRCGSPARRVCTACARRSSSGASSRKAYGRAFRISCAERRRLRRVARDAAAARRVDALEHARQARRSPSPLRGSRGPSA